MSKSAYKFDDIAEKLAEVLDSADTKLVEELADMLNSWQLTYSRSATAIGKMPAMRQILNVIEDAPFRHDERML